MDGNFFFFRTKDSYLRNRRKFRNAMTTTADSAKQKLCFKPKARAGLCCPLGRHQEGALTCD